MQPYSRVNDDPIGSSSIALQNKPRINTSTRTLVSYINLLYAIHIGTNIQIIILQAYSSSREETRFMIMLDAKLTPASFPHDDSLIAVWVLICGLE